MKSLYLLIDVCTIVVPFIFSFHKKIRFYKDWKYFLPGMLIAALLFIIWDEIFTRKGIWGFNPVYVTGIYISHLPIEEILFFIVVPYACVFTYYCLNKFFRLKWCLAIIKPVSILFSSVLLITGFYFFNHTYTSVTFISFGLLILVFQFGLKVSWLDKLLSVYPVLLIPFFIVNGVLTGSGIAQPVVWYNNNANMHVRLFTIPLEDIFYGFELIMLNVFFMSFLKIKKTNTGAILAGVFATRIAIFLKTSLFH